MNLLLKLIFYAALAINGLIGLFYFTMTFFSILFPPGPAYRRGDSLIFLAGCAVVLALLAWAYGLAMVQGKIEFGFAVLAVSYLGWLGVLVIGFVFSKGGTWQ
jgi:O-antigen/teichoic acid export membrane protein